MDTSLDTLQLRLLRSIINETPELKNDASASLYDVANVYAARLPEATAIELNIKDDVLARAYYILTKVYKTPSHIYLDYNIYNIDDYIITIPSDVIRKYEKLVMPLDIEYLGLVVARYNENNAYKGHSDLISLAITLELQEEIHEYDGPNFTGCLNDVLPMRDFKVSGQ